MIIVFQQKYELKEEKIFILCLFSVSFQKCQTYFRYKNQPCVINGAK